MDEIRIRAARQSDASSIVGFVRKLAAFEREPADSVKLTEADVLRDGFGSNPRFEVLIAEQDGTPVGFALFFPNYSTWEGRPGLYLEDIFVEESARRHGVGRKLIAAMARIARERKFVRIDLSVLDWNPARGFYRTLGFTHMKTWQPFRLTGPALDALAADSE